MFWSGGKDSALALHRIQRSGEWRVERLITTINPEFDRVSMHGVREALVEAQAQALGIPLTSMCVPAGADNETYVAALRETLARQKASGIEAVVFGDIFLRDLRAWREGFLAEHRLEGVFPLWGADTRSLFREFMAEGFHAVVCCTSDAWPSEELVGLALDDSFLARLPSYVDPCGENGEYHSFVHDGPGFRAPVRFRRGQRIYRPLAPDSTTARPAPAEDEPRIGPPGATSLSQTRGFWFIDLVGEA